MTVVESAISQMESWAADNTHGYDQQFRWNERGDFDCSSAVISAWEAAGVPVRSKGATYTGNMKPVFLACGFIDVTMQVNLQTGSGLIRGDVLLNQADHTAMYCGGGYEVEASINEFGKVTGGQPGDQTGSEFLKRPYRNFPWDCVLRYQENKIEAQVNPANSTDNSGLNADGKYICKKNDSLWTIAERFLGNGYLYKSIMTLNHIDSTEIYPGQELLIPGKAKPDPVPDPTADLLPVLQIGSNGISVKALQTLLKLHGLDLAVDGDFGSDTKSKVSIFQTAAKIDPNGVVDFNTWKALIN